MEEGEKNHYCDTTIPVSPFKGINNIFAQNSYKH